jgi:hypothetical protein
MMWEYTSAYPHLVPGGWLLSHDIHNSAAWPEFLVQKQLLTVDAELDHDLGAVRRPPVPAARPAPSGSPSPRAIDARPA